MRIGISVNSSHPNIEPRTGARWIIERVQAANEAGLDSLFVGDHHNVSKNYYQNVPLLGRLLAQWQGPRAGALFLLPLWQPVLIAEQVATLASLYEGRFILQCGLGVGRKQFSAFNASLKTRPSAFEESINALRRLWNGEVVEGDKRFPFTAGPLAPLPPEPIDIWVGASAEVAINRAAILGDGWLASPALTCAQAKQQIELYQHYCAQDSQSENRPTETGGDPSKSGTFGTCAIRRDIYIADSTREADEFRHRIHGYRGFDEDALDIGTIDVVTERFQRLKDMGYSDIIVRNISDQQQQSIDTILRLKDIVTELA